MLRMQATMPVVVVLAVAVLLAVLLMGVGGDTGLGMRMDAVMMRVEARTVGPLNVEHGVEQHHSLQPPLDKSHMYWNYGGSTVLAQRSIRLTPSTQDRRGWLWNDYPMESAQWEVELTFNIFSRPHFGGDGMCMWMISTEQDPSSTAASSTASGTPSGPPSSSTPAKIEGSVFGMRADFHGFGVCVDVYDNDGRRNNPSIFVLHQNDTRVTPARQWAHDSDFENDMVRTKPSQTAEPPPTNDLGKRAALSFPTEADATTHKCTAELRNAGHPTRMLVKYLHRVLHVYIDTYDYSATAESDDTSNGGGGGSLSSTATTRNYRFCLAVGLAHDMKEYHLAFTAATGQVADTYELHEISTRYLSASDDEFDDSTLRRMQLDRSALSSHSRLFAIFWFVVNLLSLALITIVAFQLHTFRTLTHDRIDVIEICSRINPFVLPHYAAHALIIALLLVTGYWILVLCNVPMLVWKLLDISKREMLFTAALVGPSKGHAAGKINVNVKLGIAIGFYATMQLVYLYHMLG